MKESKTSNRKFQFKDKVSAEELSFMVGEKKDIVHTAWYTVIETLEGRKIHISDPSSPVGMMEAVSKYRAIKKGKEFLKRLQEEITTEV